MAYAQHTPERTMDLAWMAFLATKPRPRLVGKTCASDQRACRRPVWGDGRVDGEWYGLCSRCWHEHNAFHGVYLTMQANPAAAKLSLAAIRDHWLYGGQRLPYTLPPGTCPDAPPADW